MTSKGKIKLLILTNVITLALGGFLVWQKYANKKKVEETKVAAIEKYHFKDNAQYEEQMDFYSIFHDKVNIVFLGNSHFFRMHWNELLQRGDIANRGIGSDITEGYLSRMEYILNTKPKICFIEGGGNDLDINVPLDTIVNNLNKITQILKTHQIIPVLNTVFYASKLYKSNDSNQYNCKVDTLNAKISYLAKTEQIMLIDINDQLNMDGYLKSEYGRVDGIHLTSKAYLIWKSEIEKILIKKKI